MKTKMITLAFFALLFTKALHAQDITTVNAKSSDISDNLDLRAVASVFGDSENLEDFERRLNDPKNHISNLDLNNDGNVDYLRIIESVENGTHLIIIQSVLERDVFQDVATVEVEKDNNNQVQVQVVGDVYMYGQNYIYEPVYVSSPVIYNTFWIGSYRPYYSPWYWNYYPVYYSYWAPYPVYSYRRHIHSHIHDYNHYNYVNTRRSQRAVALYSTRRTNGYEKMHPNRSFTERNNVTNRYELDKTRKINTPATTRTAIVRNNNTKTTERVNNGNIVRSNSNSATVKNNGSATVRSSNVRESVSVQKNAPERNINRADTKSFSNSAQPVAPKAETTVRNPARAIAEPTSSNRSNSVMQRNATIQNTQRTQAVNTQRERSAQREGSRR